MNTYLVTMNFMYSDTVEIKAEDEERALEAALEVCNEQYQEFYDSEVICTDKEEDE